MTVVPEAFQLTAWIPAWWRGAVGGDDLSELLGWTALEDLAQIRSSAGVLSAYCPDLGVSVLPGPKPTTEAAVAAGQAVILHGTPGSQCHLLIPDGGHWQLLQAGASRPLALDLQQADTELTQAVVHAEHELRGSHFTSNANPRPTTIRPLPPDAGGANRALLVRAARLWNVVSAVPADDRTAGLEEVLRCAARATLAAYAAPPRQEVSQRRYA